MSEPLVADDPAERPAATCFERRLAGQLVDVKSTISALHGVLLGHLQAEMSCLRRELAASRLLEAETQTPRKHYGHAPQEPPCQLPTACSPMAMVKVSSNPAQVFQEQAVEPRPASPSPEEFVLPPPAEARAVSPSPEEKVPNLRSKTVRTETVRRATESANPHVAEEVREWTQKEQEHELNTAVSRQFEEEVPRESFCRRHAAAVVDAPCFDISMSIVIFVNCITIGAEVQMFAAAPAAEQTPVFGIANIIIFVVFLVELLLRIAARGFRDFFCFSSSLGWNYFDTFVVATSVFDFVGGVLLSAGGSAADMTNMRVFRVIKMARLLRIARSARVLRFVSALRMLVYSMVVSLKSVIWALILFMLIIYVCAIVFTQEVAQNVFEQGIVDISDPRLIYWGSLYASMFTLYKSICGGVDWHVVVVPLQEIHLTLAWLFAMFIWFMYFVALNVITGVFCSTALSAAANDPEIIAMGLQVSKATRQTHAVRLFKAIDGDNSGHITISELMARLDDAEVQGLFIAIGVDSNDAVALFGIMDVDKSGLVDSTEFVNGCVSLRGAVKNVDFVKAASETRRVIDRLDEITAALETLMTSAGLGHVCAATA